MAEGLGQVCAPQQVGACGRNNMMAARLSNPRVQHLSNIVAILLCAAPALTPSHAPTRFAARMPLNVCCCHNCNHFGHQCGVELQHACNLSWQPESMCCCSSKLGHGTCQFNLVFDVNLRHALYWCCSV